MRRIYLGAVLAATLAVSACGGAANGPSTAPVTAPSSAGLGATSSAPSGETVEITVGTDTGAELKFDPAEVTIPAGAMVRVTFENRSSVPHNLTIQAPINVATATVVEPGSSEAVEFQAPDRAIRIRLHVAPGHGRNAHRHRFVAISCCARAGHRGRSTLATPLSRTEPSDNAKETPRHTCRRHACGRRLWDVPTQPSTNPSSGRPWRESVAAHAPRRRQPRASPLPGR